MKIKVKRNSISTLFILDKNLKKIQRIDSKGRKLLNRKGRESWEVRICDNDNLDKIKKKNLKPQALN